MTQPVSKMSDSELSLLIAEFLEPQASLGSARDYVNAWGWNKGTHFWSNTWIPNDDRSDTIPGWWPRNMVTDPAMTVMLMEKLGEMWTTVTLSKRGVRISVRTKRIPLGHQGARYIIKWVKGETLGRAVAEVFVQANGLGEG